MIVINSIIIFIIRACLVSWLQQRTILDDGLTGRCECCREVYNIPDFKMIEKSHKIIKKILKWFKLFMIYVFIPTHFFVVVFLNPFIAWVDRMTFVTVQYSTNPFYDWIGCYIFSYVLVITIFGVIVRYILHDLYPKIAKERLKKIVINNDPSNIIPIIFMMMP